MRDQRAFTLVELMISVAILAVIIAGVYGVFGPQEKAYILQERMAEMNQNARVALEFMSYDIRNAGFDPTLATTMGAGAGIQTATATTIVFSQDTNADSDLQDSEEFMGYRFDAGNEQIDYCTGGGACGAWQPFIDGVQNLQFRYVYEGDTAAAPLNSDTLGLPSDADGDDRNDFEDIREVEIQIIAERAGETGQGAGEREGVMERFIDTTLTSRVKVRNLDLR